MGIWQFYIVFCSPGSQNLGLILAKWLRPKVHTLSYTGTGSDLKEGVYLAANRLLTGNFSELKGGEGVTPQGFP